MAVKTKPKRKGKADPATAKSRRKRKPFYRSPEAYERHKAESRESSRQRSLAGRDIGPVPDVVDLRRRRKALGSLLAFCGYHPSRFPLPFSADQLETIAECQATIDAGGKKRTVMPRGSGKTQIHLTAVEWALYTGRWKNVYLVAANTHAAKRLIRAIKEALMTNDLLLADFPEVCFPIRCLGDKANRCKGQHIGGKPTMIRWGSQQVVFPTVEGSLASGAVLNVTGILCSDLRGDFHVIPGTGEVVRPQGVVLDDVQNDGTAINPARVEKLLDAINSTVMGMEGPGDSLTILCPGTILAPGDVIDTLGDQDLYPEWSGKVYKMLYQFPTNMKLWEEYAHLRADGFRRGDKLASEATRFYRARRAEMDAGAAVAWEHRYRPKKGEASAIQCALDIFFDTPAVFWKEYQNEPKLKVDLQDQLTREEIVGRTNNLARGTLPLWTNHLTGYIDVQGSLLYWVVAAWRDDFTGAVVDYGCWPNQDRHYWTLEDASVKFKDVPAIANAGVEASIRYALGECVGQLRRRAWVREGGGALLLDRIGIDTGFQGDAVCEWVRSSEHGQVLVPTRGRGIGAKNRPLSEYTKRDPRERLGFHWRLNASERKGLRVLEIDTNFWKTFVASRLRQAVGDRGALALFGRPGTDHRMLADHWCAEMCRPQTDEISGRTVDEWTRRPGLTENHWWDGIVGCAALACFLGADLAGGTTKARPRASSARPTLEELRRGTATPA